MSFKLFLCAIIVTVLCFISGSECDYNFFVSKQQDEDKYYCITNTSFALTWNFEDISENSVSNFVPARPEHKLRFNWSWEVTYSFRENIHETILDRRWEELEVIKTEPVKNDENLTYVHVHTTFKDDLEIAFSARADREAHVFLCDGYYPPKANCYWFKLQARSSTIKKCRENEIPEKNNYVPEEPCTHLIRIEHPNDPLYLSKKYWSHLKIGKKSNYLYLSRTPFEEKILKWTDKSPLPNIRYMIIHNNRDVAYWKIHETKMIYTEKKRTENFFVEAPKESLIDDSLCISMYLLMCKSCQLRIKLSQKYGTEKVYNSSPLGWSEIKFVADQLIPQDTVLEILPIGDSEDRFWAIDSIRQCNNKEFRMISTNVSAPCQLMSKNNYTILFGYSKLENLANNECPNDTSGEFCVPCNKIYDKCENISICSKDDKTDQQIGFCSTGYENDNSFGTSFENINLLYLLLLLLLIIPLSVLIILLFRCKERHHQSKNNAKDKSVTERIPSNSFGSAEVITYENIRELSSKIVSVENFPMYVKKCQQNGELDHQHATVLLNLTRKIYHTTLGCQYFDYIDMEYINGSKITKAYIAGETPKLSQFNDFWKAIWDENVEHLLFFDDAERDDTFERYWPENTAIMICHGISLQLAFVEDLTDYYKCRNFILIYGKEVRQVRQIHFSYCGLNPEKYVSLLKKLSKIQLKSISPVFIHSSVGLGGTGFILLCDMSLRMAAKEDAVDILRNMRRLYDQKSDLVNDLQLYKLAHLVISKYFTGPKLI